MNVQIKFKNDKLAVVENLKEVHAGRQTIAEPYIGLLAPDCALTFVGDTTFCCNSNDVLFITIK